MGHPRDSREAVSSGLTADGLPPTIPSTGEYGERYEDSVEYALQ
jgi:hypothetical protein